MYARPQSVETRKKCKVIASVICYLKHESPECCLYKFICALAHNQLPRTLVIDPDGDYTSAQCLPSLKLRDSKGYLIGVDEAISLLMNDTRTGNQDSHASN
jgi:hypothetical protein